MACLRLVTFLPERPDLSCPRFISCMARLTFLPAFAPYLRRLDDFLCAMVMVPFSTSDDRAVSMQFVCQRGPSVAGGGGGSEDVAVEPLEVPRHGIEHELGLLDAVRLPRVDDHLRDHSLSLERVVELVALRDGHALVRL